jgi:hypothetical protein
VRDKVRLAHCPTGAFEVKREWRSSLPSLQTFWKGYWTTPA